MEHNRGELSMMNAADWHEITKAKKLVRANDSSFCGNAIAEYRDNIVILEHGANFRKYIIPKSIVERYDGSDIYLNIPRSMLSTFDF
jgi:uncharacterized protein (DUF427 family)